MAVVDCVCRVGARRTKFIAKLLQGSWQKWGDLNLSVQPHLESNVVVSYLYSSVRWLCECSMMMCIGRYTRMRSEVSGCRSCLSWYHHTQQNAIAPNSLCLQKCQVRSQHNHRTGTAFRRDSTRLCDRRHPSPSELALRAVTSCASLFARAGEGPPSPSGHAPTIPCGERRRDGALS